METNQLRINNWVKDSDDHGEFYQIEEIYKDGFKAGPMTVYPAGMDFDYGIPLTEEWLLKFGFEPNGVYKSMRLPIDDLTKEGTRTFIVCTLDQEGWIEIISKHGTTEHPKYSDEQTCFLPLRSVHQLQNLYFALTGTELETKD